MWLCLPIIENMFTVHERSWKTTFEFGAISSKCISKQRYMCLCLLLCVCLWLLCVFNGCFISVLVYRFHSCQYSFVLLNLFLDLCVYVCVCARLQAFILFYLLLCMSSARLEPHSILNASYLPSYIAACCTCPCYLWSTRLSTSYFCVHELQCVLCGILTRASSVFWWRHTASVLMHWGRTVN